jgi:hypothetical protein
MERVLGFSISPRWPIRFRDWVNMSGFEPIVRSPNIDPIDPVRLDQVQTGLRSLVGMRGKRSSPELEAIFLASDAALILELLMMHGGYRVFLFANHPQGPVFASNVQWQLSRTSYRLGRAGDLQLSPMDPGSWDRVSARLLGPTFGPEAEGIGGRFGVYDGEYQFLRVKNGDDIHQTIGRAYRFGPSLDEDFGRPGEPDEVRKWDAIRTTLAMGLDYLVRQNRPIVLRHRMPLTE